MGVVSTQSTWGLLNCLLYDKDRHQITNTMKAFIFLCLVAAAMAEADPQFLYGNYGYNTFPSTYAYGGAYSPYTYGYNSFHYGKREAEADPALIYSSGYHYPTVYSGLSHGVYNTHYTTPYVYGGIHHLGKREAEADPALVYSSGFHYPSVYSGIYNTHYTTPYTYGLHHYGKREAEPKADAALIYSGLHYPSTYGYGLHNYGYSGLYNHGIYSGIHTYGKREAEAEPWRSYYGGYSGYRPYSGYGYGGFGGYRGYRGWY